MLLGEIEMLQLVKEKIEIARSDVEIGEEIR